MRRTDPQARLHIAVRVASPARRENETIRQDLIPRDLLQQVQEPQNLIERAGPLRTPPARSISLRVAAGGCNSGASRSNCVTLAETLAGCIRDRRNQAQVVHSLSAMLRFRMFAIACGYEDADDCDALRTDPLFKVASGKAPESGRALCSQPTMSRLENAPSRIEVARMTAALVDLFCRSFSAPPAAITLDIDDTCDAVHGHQQLSLFHAHYDTRCFLPVHVYHVESGKPVAVLLRPGKTPSGPAVRTLLKHLVRRIRRHWPRTRIVFRGDSHYGRTQAMAWCEENGVDYIFGIAGNHALATLAYEVADDLKVRCAEAGAEKMRNVAAFACAVRSWSRKRRVATHQPSLKCKAVHE